VARYKMPQCYLRNHFQSALLSQVRKLKQVHIKCNSAKIYEGLEFGESLKISISKARMNQTILWDRIVLYKK